MPREFEQIRCQRCRAANPLGQELCDRCGTRLMLVVEPTSMRFEEESLAGGEAGSLLAERVSVLENNLTRFAEKLERTLDLMLRQVQSAHTDHLLLEALIDVLAEARALDRASLARHWRATVERDKTAKADLRESPREKILAGYGGEEAQKVAFEKFVEEGLEELAGGDVDAGVRSLERATLLSRENFALLSFVGEYFFREGQTALAARYLGQAFVANRRDVRTTLLLGLALADEGEEVETARELIATAAELGPASFAARYALGRLAALAGDWPLAAAEFKKALAARPCAEAHFVLALANFRRGRLRLALGHAAKSLKLDADYAAAFRLLGLVRHAAGEDKLAGEAFARAAALAGEGTGRGRKRKTSARASEELLLHSFFGSAGLQGAQLLTSGDDRLARLLREDALAFAPASL